AMAVGLDGPYHLFAGGGGLWETDISAVAPLLSWNSIPLIEVKTRVAFKNITRIAIIPETRIIVVTCEDGVFSAKVPASQVRQGCFRGLSPNPSRTYEWHQATGLPSKGFFGLALGRAPDRKDKQVIVTAMGAGFGDPGEIYYGWMNGDVLDFRPA